MSVLRGRVVSGIGNFSYWMERLQDHYLRKTGMLLFPGTLNVELDEPFTLPAERVRLEKEEYGGTVSVSLVRCRFQGREAWIVRTDPNDQERGDHPRTIVEVAADVKLRDRFGLADGDVVEIEVPGPAR